MVGSEVYSSEVKKTAVLMEHFRRAIGAVGTVTLTIPAPARRRALWRQRAAHAGAVHCC